MASVPEGADILFQPFVLACRKCPIQETLSYISYSLLRRMTHVFRIEAVVSELVHNYLIGREIISPYLRNHAVDAKKKASLLEDLAKAYELYFESANDGYGKGMELIGRFYNRGIYVEKDRAKAEHWLRKAIESGDTEAAEEAKKALNREE